MTCYLLLVDCVRGPVLCLGVYAQEPAPALAVAAARLCGATQSSGLGVVTATPPGGHHHHPGRAAGRAVGPAPVRGPRQ